jgi:hypothetical protein
MCGQLQRVESPYKYSIAPISTEVYVVLLVVLVLMVKHAFDLQTCAQ